MAVPTIYKYTDANAPVLSGTRGSLVALLKACLVDGYQDKPAAGWTMPFISADSQKAVFRNDQVLGTGFFVRINESSSANAYTPKLMAYELMTDIDLGAGTFIASNTEIDFMISVTASTTARPWILLATEKCFYLFVYKNSLIADTLLHNVQLSGMFFGDIKPVNPDDAYACCLSVIVNGSYWGFGALCQQSAIASATLANMNICFPRASNGMAEPIKSAITPGGGPYGAVASSWWCNDPGSCPPYVAGKSFFMHKPLISDGRINFSARGWFPGLYIACHQTCFDQLTVLEDNGRSFLTISGLIYGSSYAFYLLELTATSW